MKSQARVENGVGRSRVEDNEWETFADPADDQFYGHMENGIIETQFLGESWEKGPWIVPNRFPPNCRADKHSHNHDTVYLVTKGTMSFNDGSGWYRAGDVRWVRAGVEYGPEEAGPEGCEFILISYGPINVQWADAETYEVESTS
jgi:mannose-6-phosphate isomerase-like protein (cupin superfamily)